MNIIDGNEYSLEMRISFEADKETSGDVNDSNELKPGNFVLHATSPAGDVSTSNFIPPFNYQEILNALSAIPRSVDEFQSSLGSPRETIRSIGEKLFISLCEGRVGRLYQQSLEMVKTQNQNLRVRVTLDNEELAALPWEFLHDPVRKDFVALSSHSPVIRQRKGFETRFDSNSLITPPLNMLIVTAEVHPLDWGAEKEIEIIENLSQSTGFFKITKLINATSQQFGNALESREPFHILHFIARGVPANPLTSSSHIVNSSSVSLTQLGLLFHPNSETPNSAALTTGDLIHIAYLKRLISSIRDLRLIVMSGDHTDWLANQLAEDCPAALGWRGENTLEAYLAFTEGFYSALQQFQPLDVAVTHGRKTIDLTYPGGKEWGMPVFYLQTQDGKFFAGEKTAHILSDDFSSTTPEVYTVKNVKNQRESEKIRILLEIENENLRSIQMKLGEFGDQPPDFLNDQERHLQENISQLQSKLNDLSS